MTQSSFNLGSELCPTALPMATASAVGAASEAFFAAQALAAGWGAYLPLAGDSLIDVVISRNSNLFSAQVKTALWRKTSYLIETRHRLSGGKNAAYCASDFDVLAVFLPDRKQFVFWKSCELVAGKGSFCYRPDADRSPNNWTLLDDLSQKKM